MAVKKQLISTEDAFDPEELISTEDAFSPEKLVSTEDAFGPEELSGAPQPGGRGISGVLGAMDRAETNLGEGAYKDVQLIKESATRPNTGLPTRIAETAGNVLGGAARTGMNLLNVPLAGAGQLVKQAFPATTQALGDFMTAKRQPTIADAANPRGEGTSIADVLGMIGAPMRRLEKDNPRVAQQLKNVLSVEQVLPYGKLAQVAGKPIVAGTAEALEAGTGAATKGTGKALEGVGQFWEAKNMGLTNTQLAKYAGERGKASEGFKKLATDVSKYGLDSPMGFKKSAEKTAKMLETENQNYEKMLEKFTSKPENIEPVNVPGVLEEIRADLKANGAITDQLGAGATDRNNLALKYLDGIEEDLAKRGKNGMMLPTDIPEIKRIVSRDTRAFRDQYTVPTEEGILRQEVGKVAYLKLMDDLNGKLEAKGFKGFKEQGQKLRDLIKLQEVFEDASAPGVKFSPDHAVKILMKMAVGGGGAGALGGDPITGLIAAVAAPLALGQVNLATPSILMKTGRALQGKKTLAGVGPELTAAEKASAADIKNRAMRGRVSTSYSVPEPGSVWPREQFIGTEKGVTRREFPIESTDVPARSTGVFTAKKSKRRKK